MTIETERINYLLSAYFHQDWRCEAEDADGVIENFKRGASQQSIDKLKREINALLKDGTLLTQDFIYENDGNYDPQLQGLTVREWFEKILKILDE